jgi:hypothetical protein
VFNKENLINKHLQNNKYYISTDNENISDIFDDYIYRINKIENLSIFEIKRYFQRVEFTINTKLSFLETTNNKIIKDTIKVKGILKLFEINDFFTSNIINDKKSLISLACKIGNIDFIKSNLQYIDINNNGLINYILEASINNQISVLNIIYDNHKLHLIFIWAFSILKKYNLSPEILDWFNNKYGNLNFQNNNSI